MQPLHLDSTVLNAASVIALGTPAGVGTLLDKGGALVLQNLVKHG